MKVPPVLHELRQTLSETRHPPGRDPTATFSEVAGKLKKNENVVRKFERGESAPKFDEVDDLVAAYAEATDVAVFDLWDQAISRARKAEAKLKRGVGLEGAGPAAQKPLRDSRRPKPKRQTGS